MAIISIEDIIQNNKKIEIEKKKTLKLHLKQFGKEVIVRKITFEEFMEIDGKNADDEVIYNCLIEPKLNSDELVNKLMCRENPIEIVKKVFDRNTIKALSSKILEFSNLVSKDKDLVTEVIDDIKN